MITRISIRDYRSCLDTTIALHPHLSVLIGPNGSGKTNILNAVLLLKKLLEEEPYHSTQEQATGQCAIKAWFDIEGKTAIFSATIDLYSDQNNNDVIASSIQRWYVKDGTGSGTRISIPLFMSRHLIDDNINAPRMYFSKYMYESAIKARKMPQHLRALLASVAQELSDMRYYSASQFTNPANCPVSFEIEKEGRKSRGIRLHGHTKFLFDLYAQFKSQDQAAYGQFIDIIGPNGIGLVDGIDFKEISTSSIDYSVRSGGRVQEKRLEKILVIPQFKIGTNALSPNQLSEGTFKTITLLFYLITESSKVLLLEEPEVCVHHGLLSSILELIKTYADSKQIIISTHSDFVLDHVKPENVYKIVRSNSEGTKAFHIPKSMPRKELNALREYLDTEGNLGEYWRHGGLE